MKIVFWGTPIFSLNILDKLINSKYKVVGIVTQPDKRRSRGKQLIYSPVKKRGLELKIPVITPININKDIQSQEDIASMNADINIVVAFGQILPENILNKPRYGSWNIHASLLPRWRGAAPIQWSILEGDKYTGVGIMKMEKTLDTGPILIEKKIKIDIHHNKESLEQLLSDLSSELIVEALKKIEDVTKKYNRIIYSELKLTKQQDTNRNISYAKLINKDDYKINFNISSIDFHRRVKALYPNTYLYINSKRVKIIDCVPLERDYIEKNNSKSNSFNKKNSAKVNKVGEVLDIKRGIGFIVKTKDRAILISQAQVEGKTINSGDIVCNQMNIIIGDILLDSN